MRGNPQYPPYQGQVRPPNRAPQYYQPIRVPKPRPQRRSSGFCSCAAAFLALAALGFGILLTIYLLAPVRTDFLILGIDRVPEGTALGRSDTIIMVSVDPLKPTVKMLSIPRDLWVSIPGVGENRINTAHFFAEANQPGSGPAAAVQTVEQNFGVSLPYYVRLRFDAFQRIVDALGGVDVNLPKNMAGLPAGKHHLNGTQALAFVRDRKGTDDFFRMEHGQFMIKAVALQMISPLSWPRLPWVMFAAASSIDTDMPLWQLPRIGFAFVRAGLTNTIDNRTIQREMTTPYITDDGANVLLPDWDRIHPFVKDMFQ